MEVEYELLQNRQRKKEEKVIMLWKLLEEFENLINVFKKIRR